MATDVSVATRYAISTATVAVTSTAAALTVPANARACLVQADGDAVRIGFNATPTATSGIRLDDGIYIYIDSDPRSLMLYAASSCNAQVIFFDK